MGSSCWRRDAVPAVAQPDAVHHWTGRPEQPPSCALALTRLQLSDCSSRGRTGRTPLRTGASGLGRSGRASTWWACWRTAASPASHRCRSASPKVWNYWLPCAVQAQNRPLRRFDSLLGGLPPPLRGHQSCFRHAACNDGDNISHQSRVSCSVMPTISTGGRSGKRTTSVRLPPIASTVLRSVDSRRSLRFSSREMAS